MKAMKSLKPMGPKVKADTEVILKKSIMMN